MGLAGRGSGTGEFDFARIIFNMIDTRGQSCALVRVEIEVTVPGHWNNGRATVLEQTRSDFIDRVNEKSKPDPQKPKGNENEVI